MNVEESTRISVLKGIEHIIATKQKSLLTKNGGRRCTYSGIGCIFSPNIKEKYRALLDLESAENVAPQDQRAKLRSKLNITYSTSIGAWTIISEGKDMLENWAQQCDKGAATIMQTAHDIALTVQGDKFVYEVLAEIKRRFKSNDLIHYFPEVAETFIQEYEKNMLTKTT